MAADWNQPTLASTKTDVLSILKERTVDSYTLAETPTNPPTGAIRYVRASNKLQEWDGASWVDKVISIDSGGTGASNASSARTALGLGTLATQNSNAVSISGGTISGLTSLGVSGTFTVSGLLIAGSGPTTLTNSAGQILESAIADGTIFPRRASTETITATWTFSTNPVFNNNAIPETKIADGTVFPRLASNESITGIWTFSTNPVFNANAIPETAIADGSVYPRIGGAEVISGSWTFSNPIFANVTGLATAATYLSPGRQINGVLFDGTTNISVPADAGALFGTTINAGVTISSLTQVGTLSQVTIGNGSASLPSLNFAGGPSIAGMYYNGSNPTVEMGMYFANASNRAVIRAVGTSPPRIDFLIGNAFSVEIYENRIVPAADGSISCGATGRRWSEVWSANGVIQTSDIRHKETISWIDGDEALDSICSLDTSIGRWKQDKLGKDKFPFLSAQDVHAIIDKQFGTDVVIIDQFDVHSMYYERLIPFLCAAIRGLNGKIQKLSEVH